MVEINGLKGVYNRYHLFASTIQKDVIDVTLMMKEIPKDTSIAVNNVALRERTNKIMITGQDLTVSEFLRNLSYLNTSVQLKKEQYDMLKQVYKPEFNIVTNKIGEGYRAASNRVMLISRTKHYIDNGYDMMIHEYQNIIMKNGAMKV